MLNNKIVRYRSADYKLMNCTGFALGTFDVLSFCTDYSDALSLVRPITALQLSSLKLKQFVDNHPSLSLRVINNADEVLENEDLILFRLDVFPDIDGTLDEICLSYDCHFVRFNAGRYWWTYYGHNLFYCKESEPAWVGYEGPTLYLATNQTTIFSEYLKSLTLVKSRR